MAGNLSKKAWVAKYRAVLIKNGLYGTCDTTLSFGLPKPARKKMRFDTYIPTQLRFGAGRLRELPETAARHGTRALLAVGRQWAQRSGLEERMRGELASVGVETKESYVSPKSQPMCDLLALGAIGDVVRTVHLAIDEPGNSNARAALSSASTMMGLNLACVGACFPHRADKALCALYSHIAHARSVAVFYPVWLRSCWRVRVNRFARIARLLDPAIGRLSDSGAAEAMPELIVSFMERIGLKSSVLDLGIDAICAPALVSALAGDLTVNPIPLSRDQAADLIHQAIVGS